MAKKVLALALLTALLCAPAVSAQAGRLLNIYLDKDALLACDVSAAEIRIRPEGMVRVTRQALWPWDGEGTQWSLLAEIENTSLEIIVIDEDWLYACKKNREEIGRLDYALYCTTNTLLPGERALVTAGVEPRVRDVGQSVTDEALGLAQFAGKIRQAKVLRLRFDTRGSESGAYWKPLDVDARAWIEGGALHFEATNSADEPLSFRTIGAVACDGEGRLMDMILTSHDRVPSGVAPGETLEIEKPLAPYITDEMIDGWHSRKVARRETSRRHFWISATRNWGRYRF